MSYIYLYTNTHAKHIHTCMHHANTHTLSCRPHSLLCYCAWEPLSAKRLSSEPLAPANVHANTLKKHTKSRALILLAIVQPFHSSKPYHQSLHSCSLSISIRQACIVFYFSSRRRRRKTKKASLISLSTFLSPFFVSDGEDRFVLSHLKTSAFMM